MLFDDLDKKIKEAAEQHHPAYDEKAWQKMEKLLDQHLPQQKDDRRRIIFFSLLFLLIGGGAFLLIPKVWNRKSGSNQLVQDQRTSVRAGERRERANTTTVAVPKNESVPNQTPGPQTLVDVPEARSTVTTAVDAKSVSPLSGRKPGLAANDAVRNRQINQTTRLSASNGNADTKEPVDNRGNFDAKQTSPEKNTSIVPDNSSVQQAKTANDTDVTNKSVFQNNVKPDSDQAAANTETKTVPQRKSPVNRNGFSFFVSAGPDVSKAGSSKTGKTTLVYGAGIAYTKNRISLRTGIFASRKIYWAGSKDYKLSWVPAPTVKFAGADANCDVIEVPLKLSYAFGMTDRSNWFAGAGLSSYLMKKEKYVYTYKTASGSYYYPYQTRNENKHYFSVLDLSAGYTRQINRTVSITAEPYVEIPLVGIGVGKVHLNSGGILFTVGIKPFKK